jgi:hypothetical protein
MTAKRKYITTAAFVALMTTTAAYAGPSKSAATP